MRNTLAVLAALVVIPGFAQAESFPFGSASAYNLVALGSAGTPSTSAFVGNIATNADITGRIAAANQVTLGTTVGSSLNADPYGTSSAFAVVSTNGFNAGETFNINGGGNVYAPGANGLINFNNGGTRITSGSSGLDFANLRTTLENESASLANLPVNGTNLGTGNPGFGNPSFYVLRGSSSTLNVFNINASVFGDLNHPLDIVVPNGSTVVINVSGTNATLATGIYYNGVQYTGNDTTTSNVLFNFPTAATVTVAGQLQASVLAPYAFLSGNAQMGGTFIAAEIGQTGEVHNIEFTGTIAPTPEPATLALLGTGVLGMAGIIRRKKRTGQVAVAKEQSVPNTPVPHTV